MVSEREYRMLKIIKALRQQRTQEEIEVAVSRLEKELVKRGWSGDREQPESSTDSNVRVER